MSQDHGVCPLREAPRHQNNTFAQ